MNSTPSTPIQTKTEPKSIFKSPIIGREVALEKVFKEKRKKNMLKGYIYLGIAVILLGFYSVWFLYPQASLYLKSETLIQEKQEKIDQYVSVELPSLQAERDAHESAYDQELQKAEAVVDQIFPGDINKIGLIRRLENFATLIHTKNPPFEFNSISFGKPVKGPGYSVVPISTSIKSSRKNFNRFLELINLSGRFDTEVPIRLMEISSINVRYKGADVKTGKDKGVDFSVKLNAYFR